jgi:hypothetical protein
MLVEICVVNEHAPLIQVLLLNEYRVGEPVRVKGGHSGYPKNAGRVIRVVGNSGIKNCYPIFAPKKYYPKFWVPDNSGSGSGFTRYTRN